MQYLADIYGKKTLAGQYTSGDFVKAIEGLYNLTGKYPALRGSIFCMIRLPSAGREGPIPGMRSSGAGTAAW